nr:hypothetical protein [Achromobacter ruhlandii]
MWSVPWWSVGLAGASILGLYPPTDPATKDKFAAWRKEQGR